MKTTSKKPPARSNTKGATLVFSGTTHYISFRKTHYFVGADKEKVARGITDKRELSKLYPGRSFNPGLLMSEKKKYTAKFTREVLEHASKLARIKIITPKP